MALTGNIPSFGGGEYSPQMYSRVDIQRYAIGLRRCRNFIIHPQGGVSNRTGTYKAAATKNAGFHSRIVPFIFNIDQAYTLEFGGTTANGSGYVRFFTDNEQITLNPSTVYEVATPWTEPDLTYLRFESSADVIYITSPDFKTYTLSRYAETDWRLEAYTSDDGPFMSMNLDLTLSMNASATSGVTTLNAASSYFNALNVGSLFKLRHYVQGQIVSKSYTGTGVTASISCFTTWRVISHGTWTGTFAIEKSVDNGTTWTTLRKFSSVNDTNVNTFGTEDIENNTEPFLLRLNMTNYTSGTANIDLTSDPFYQDGICRALTYNSATSMTVDVLTNFASTATTIEWSEGSWSNRRGFPAVAKFVQDRLAFASTYSEPMTTWMTQTSNYVSFLRHSILLDTDGISVNLPTRQLNAINGLVSLRKLVALTSSSEWTIGATSGNTLTAKSLEQLPQGYRGSSGIEPAIIGNECIFVQTGGKVVRNLNYQFANDGYVGTDLNIFARHLFQNYSIVEMAYQQSPDSILWCLRSDGVLLALTYMQEQEVIAWSWHDTQGTIESICVIPANEYDELWMIVKRETGRYVEYVTPRMVANNAGAVVLEDQIFMDCAVTFPANTLITGMTHLEGQTVQVLEGGVPLAQEKVTSGGLPSMTMSSATVHVGLPYYSDLETLNIELGMKDGTMQGRKVKIGNVTFRVTDTRGGWVGPNENNLYEAFPAIIDSILFSENKYYDDNIIYDDPYITYEGALDPTTLFSGDIRLPLGAGYEDGGRVFYRQVSPLPVSINAIIPELAPGGAAG